jgi:hypothetical protein
LKVEEKGADLEFRVEGLGLMVEGLGKRCKP